MAAQYAVDDFLDEIFADCDTNYRDFDEES